jgi:hypothetical protein
MTFWIEIVLKQTFFGINFNHPKGVNVVILKVVDDVQTMTHERVV